MLAALQRILADLGFHTDIITFIVMFGLVLARLAAAIALTPFLGGRAVFSRIKIGLALVISILLVPSVVPTTNVGDFNTVRVICLLIKEAVIGATLGFLTQIIFSAVQMAGAVVDYGRGMSQATFFAPQLESNISLLGQLQFQAALVLFLILNGHLLFIRALGASFRNVPLLDFPHFSGGTLGGMEQIAHYTSDSLLIAVQLGAPAQLALFLVDIGFGMIGRVASGINVHNESQPIKALVGLGVIMQSQPIKALVGLGVIMLVNLFFRPAQFRHSQPRVKAALRETMTSSIRCIRSNMSSIFVTTCCPRDVTGVCAEGSVLV